MAQGRFPEGTFLLLIGTAYIVAASVFPGGLIELAFLTASGNSPLEIREPGVRFIDRSRA